MTTYYMDGELQAMMDEFGVDVTISGVTAKGLVDRVDEDMLRALGYAMGKVVMVQVKTGAFPGLALGVTATVDGAAWKVREIGQIDDGAVTKLLLAKE